jgi:uncharacterized protein (TIGR02145 family)
MANKLRSILIVSAVICNLLILISCSADKSSNSPSVPVLTTAVASDISRTTAQCGGNITSDGGADIIARGVCWSTSQAPTVADGTTTDGTGTGSFTSLMTGLTERTLYYIRAYATNSHGTGYGSVLSFYTTDSTGTVTDTDGNVYRTVKINNQWWMAENLRVTHYRNGNVIPLVSDSAAWTALTSGAYCNPNHDAAEVDVYGRLYNWYAVNNADSIAPTGWHVATDAEWQALIDYCGGDAVAGGKLKEAGTIHWITPNLGATNESGFSGLPAGFRYENGSYYGFEAHGNFWTATAGGGNTAWYRYLHCTITEVIHFSYYMGAAFSVRCVRD